MAHVSWWEGTVRDLRGIFDVIASPLAPGRRGAGFGQIRRKNGGRTPAP